MIARTGSDFLLSFAIFALLARTLGPGKAQVQVNADLNVDGRRTPQMELVEGCGLH